MDEKMLALILIFLVLNLSHSNSPQALDPGIMGKLTKLNSKTDHK